MASHSIDSHQKIAQDKDLLRFSIRRARSRRFIDRKIAEESFAKHLQELIALKGGPLTLAAYLPLSSEPPLMQALTTASHEGSTVLVPVVEPKRQLSWVKWSSTTKFTTNALGIKEPVGPRYGAETFLEADLKLVPALGYDVQGYRLGQGGGYYDRLLPAETLAAEASLPHSEATFYGVVFAHEIFDSLPHDSWDARLPRVMTEEGLRSLTLKAQL